MRFRIAYLLLAFAVLPSLSRAWAEDYFAIEKCSLCHIRRSVFFDPGFATPDRLSDYNEERLCGSCHNASVRDSRAVLWRGAQHPALADAAKGGGKRCSVCHNPHEKGGWEVLAGTSISLRKSGNAVCGGCHPGQAPGGGLHGNNFPDGGCRECHQAHGGSGKSLLRESRETICMRCHGSLSSDKSSGHPLQQCTSCHPVHRKEVPAGFAASRCRGCHEFDRKGKERTGRAHPAEENCLECHSFHADSGVGGRRFRGKDISANVLCSRCHEPYRAETTGKADEKGTHVTVRPGGGEDLCLKCHAVHRPAPGTPLLVSGKPYFCLACHENQNTIRQTGAIALAHPVFEKVEKGRLAKAVQTGKVMLGPAGEITCGTCHTVHRASAGTRLMNGRFKSGESCFWCHEGMKGKQHAPMKYFGGGSGCGKCHPVHGRVNQGNDPWKNLCGECHRKDTVHKVGMTGREIGHPQDMPVFDARGKKSPWRGAVSCPTCHEPHGVETRRKRLRREYELSGFLCTACHRDKETVALTPHDLRGIAGRSVCEPCHLPHSSTSSRAAEVPDMRRTGEEACRSCHREKGMGSVVPEGGHPRNFIVPRPLPSIFPLFGAVGGRKEGGAMSCSTCHEVHGLGILPEGRGTGMLLRGDCRSCHEGKETVHGKAVCASCHPPHTERNPTDACRSCHNIGENGTAGAHTAAGKGCGTCHRVHNAGKAKRMEDRCVVCHPQKGKINGTPHGKMDGGACKPCHPAHGNLEVAQTKKRSWEETFTPNLPCLRCHREEGPGKYPRWLEHPKSVRKVPTSYGATVSLETPIYMFGRFQEGGRPLFPLFGDNGSVSMNGRMGCMTCHDPHEGSAQKTADGRRAAGYLRDPSGIFLSDICRACHRDDASEHARGFHVIPRKTN